MRKPVVDYRKLRLTNITSPEFSHLLYLLGWVGYFLAYFLTENLIPAEACTPVKIALDDLIPFCEYFVIPYVFWYALVAGSLLYFALYNVESFKNLQKFIIFTQVVAMAIYIIFPNRQDLRPDPAQLANGNIFARFVLLIQTFDTPTNVCPSLHVGYSIALASVWLKEKSASVWWKIFVVIAVVSICLSTAFIKQHSIFDAFAALPMCLAAELFVYGKSFYFRKRQKA